jgi:hypothetical protein
MVAIYLSYLTGCGGSGLMSPSTPERQSPFTVSRLCIQPVEARPNEPVNITVSVTNTYHTWGIYSLLLKIDGIKEAEKQAEVRAGTTEEVRFVVTRERPGGYSVYINGLNGTFRVAAPEKMPDRIY